MRIGRQKRAAGEPIALGTMTQGTPTSTRQPNCSTCSSGAGGTLVDTADVYAEGESEKILVVFFVDKIAATPSSSRQSSLTAQ